MKQIVETRIFENYQYDFLDFGCSSTDLVTIIIPTLNSERVLESCLTSILNQTYSEIEVILVDGGSTDQTLAIANLYPILIRKTDFSNRAYQRNFGVQCAKGTWILYIDSDEVLHPKLVESCVELASREHLQGILISTVDTGSTYFGKSRCLGDLINIRLKPNPDIPNSVLRFCSKSSLQSLGGYDETLVIGEDSILKNKYLRQTMKPRRCKYSMLHFGTERLRNIFLKKYMYGKNLRIYHAVAKEEGLDISEAYTNTGLFYFKNLLKYRDYASRFLAGYVVVKTIETVGLLSGYFVSIVPDFPKRAKGNFIASHQ